MGKRNKNLPRYRPEIWRTIRHAMIEQNIDNLNELAAYAGISKPTLIKAMRGGICRASTLDSIADVLEISVKKLMVK